jgi:hypothetical protein
MVHEGYVRAGESRDAEPFAAFEPLFAGEKRNQRSVPFRLSAPIHISNYVFLPDRMNRIDRIL